MSKDRDTRRTHTPPEGVREQIAVPTAVSADDDTPVQRPNMKNENWEGDTGTHDTEEAEERLRRRVKETNVAVAETATNVVKATVSIDTLRLETKKHIDRLGSHLIQQDHRIDKVEEKVDDGNKKIDELGGQVSTLNTHMTHVRSTVDNILPTLLTTLTDDRAARRADEHVRLTATVDVDTHQKKAQIDVTSARKKFRYEMPLKIASLLSGGGIVGYILSQLTC